MTSVATYIFDTFILIIFISTLGIFSKHRTSLPKKKKNKLKINNVLKLGKG